MTSWQVLYSLWRVPRMASVKQPLSLALYCTLLGT
jgi:hypothetical protein